MAKGIDQAAITEHTPLRLARAADLAFPDGGMTASGLRRERDRGNLVTELIAGKEFVTLAAIAEMRERCRDARKVPGYGSARNAVTRRLESFESAHLGSSAMDRNLSPPDAFLTRLKKRKFA